MLEKPNQMKGNIWSSYFEIGKQTKVMLHRKRKKLTLMKICLHNNSLYYSYNLSVSIIFSSVAQSCPTLCNPMYCSTPGLPVHHQLLEFTQTHVHRVGDAIQPSHPLSSPSPPALNLSQHRGLYKWVSSSHQSKYWSFSFNISPSNEHSGLISFRMDWLDLFAFQGTLKSLLQYQSWKALILRYSAFL